MNKVPFDPDDLKRRLVDPFAVAQGLGLTEGARRQARGLMVRCPWHCERSPSCSVRVASSGYLAARCFGCGQGGNVFSLAAAALGLDVRADFARVGQELDARCGLDGSAPLPPAPQAHPARIYPPDVGAVWERCGKVCADRELREQLEARSIDVEAVSAHDLARALPAGLLPRWCRSWQPSGHRLVLPLYDAQGNLASLHGRTLAEDRHGKGRFPAGHTNRGLVMADATARDVLATGTAPWWSGAVFISEGATDFLSLATRWGDSAEQLPATLGIYEGAWSAVLAARIPKSSEVRILTDPDEKGRKYAAQILESLSHCKVLVWKESPNHG